MFGKSIKKNSDIKWNRKSDPTFEPTAPLDHRFPQWSFFRSTVILSGSELPLDQLKSLQSQLKHVEKNRSFAMLNNQVSVKTLRRVREAAHLLNVLTLAGGLICIQTDKILIHLESCLKLNHKPWVSRVRECKGE